MTTKLKGKMTARELMAILHADPEFMAEQTERQREFKKRSAELDKAEKPLIKELRKAGLSVGSVWDLVNTSTSYTEALPILLKHLENPSPPAIREGIARALAVREAKFAWSKLKEMYKRELDKRVKDGLAAALAEIADESLLEELLVLIRNMRLGSSRVLLLRAIQRSRDHRIPVILNDLANDPELQEEVHVMLRRLKRRKKG